MLSLGGPTLKKKVIQCVQVYVNLVGWMLKQFNELLIVIKKEKGFTESAC